MNGHKSQALMAISIEDVYILLDLVEEQKTGGKQNGSDNDKCSDLQMDFLRFHPLRLTG